MGLIVMMIPAKKRKIGSPQIDSEICPTQYNLQTYNTRDEAETDEAYVTHTGQCGVCSTAQDMGALMKHAGNDMVNTWMECSKEGYFDNKAGLECFQNLGFSTACADMLFYRGYNTRGECLRFCLWNSVWAYNKPAPSCDYTQCLECDELQSNPLFLRYAGRDCSRSGILTDIVRPCSKIANITQELPCKACR